MPSSLQRMKAEMLFALAHPIRIALIEELREGEIAMGVLAERMEMNQANASQHLAILRRKNVITYRREGIHVFYSIRDREIVEVLDILTRYFDELPSQ